MKAVALLLAVLIAQVLGDCYMHNPRGSNDRLNEANENRNNANRLFDSQNNAKGGYCYGPAMSFYEGSLLTIEWTIQHGCGQNPKVYCNLVIQYMCSNTDDSADNRVRDGTTTDTIDDSEAGVTATDATGLLTYGMHENRVYYDACNTRERNKGLFIADRQKQGNLNGDAAVNTRQNNNGDRHGFECPEERDYYPYWAPTPWRDVAVLTHDMSWCTFYQTESQNVKSRYFCADPTNNGAQAAENNEPACLAAAHKWVEVPAWGIPPPVCVQSPWSRDNHLGNSIDGFQASFNWTLPSQNEESCIANDNCNCVLRIRYNISTNDLGTSGNRPDSGFIDWTSNGANSPVQQDPYIAQDGLNMSLAIDTSQFGRTFQDRSHMFHIRPRPPGISPLQRIFNLNVRGKRGNIVQAYPATEYDFVPTFFTGRAGDYVHFQWTGCDTNPAGNAGEGTAGTDRSNMVQISDFDTSVPATDAWIASNTPLFETKQLRQWMSMLGQTNCLSLSDLQKKNNNNQNAIETDPSNCMKLNAAPQYFDGGLIRMNQTGTFYYMSSRNNNFTNRGQKGEMVIAPLLPVWATVIVCVGAGFFLASGGLAGAMLYAKSHPHSKIAATLSKI
jgi:hypothetical protein